MSGILGDGQLGDFGLGFGPDAPLDDGISVGDTISLSDGATVVMNTRAFNTIELEDGALARLNDAANNDIEITQGCLINKSVNLSAGDTITVTDTAERNVYYLSAGNIINVTHAVFTPIHRTIGDELEVEDGARSGLIKELVGDNLTHSTITIDPLTLTLTETPDIHSLHDGASCTLESPKTVGNTISLSQGCTRVVVHATAIDCEASNEIELVDGSDADPPIEASNEITVTDGASYEVGDPPVGHDLIVTDGASVILIREISGGNTLNVGQGVTYALIRNCTEEKYTPFVGGATTGPTPPPTTLPVAAGVDGFRLQWPATGTVTDDLLLPNPQMGNSQRITKSRIQRETRGGTLIVYSDPVWPKFDALVVTISFLTATQKEALLTFVSTHLGQNVKLIDWENREWVGIVLPGDLITEDRRDSFTAAFEFEGERVLS